MITTNGPYRFMLTITPKYEISDNQMIQCTNLLLHFINRRLYGNKYGDNKRGLTGFIAAERQNKRSLNSECHTDINKMRKHLKFGSKQPPLHFHLLIKEDEKNSDFTTAQFRRFVAKHARKITRESSNGSYFNVFDVNGIDVTEIYDVNGISEYIAKNLENNESSSIHPFDFGGFCFIAEEIRR
ncbi:hypothetical protein [Solemya pervernicosa gill symbiont]|nr:hypothetical protein [Solemya pervernicosa gill symbiont]